MEESEWFACKNPERQLEFLGEGRNSAGSSALPTGQMEPTLLNILADALEEAGATAGLVDHLRGLGPHIRGCLAIDALTGRS